MLLISTAPRKLIQVLKRHWCKPAMILERPNNMCAPHHQNMCIATWKQHFVLQKLSSWCSPNGFLNPLNGHQGNEAWKRQVLFLPCRSHVVVLLSSKFSSRGSKVDSLRNIGKCENLEPSMVGQLLSNRLVCLIIRGCRLGYSLLLHISNDGSSHVW